MINPEYKRIAGIHVQEDGTIGAVWLAHDKLDDSIKVYDACKFEREVPVVIAEGLNARGRWIPIAWRKKDKEMADKLLDRGCRMLYEGSDDSDASNELVSREIWERMRSHRFTVDSRLKNLIEEMESLNYDEKKKIPSENFPLMAALRHAIQQLGEAKRQITRKTPPIQRRVAII